MIELLLVTKSKDSNGNNYSFAARMDITREELEKIIFSSSMFPIRWDSGVAYISTDDLAICRISEVEDQFPTPSDGLNSHEIPDSLED